MHGIDVAPLIIGSVLVVAGVAVIVFRKQVAGFCRDSAAPILGRKAAAFFYPAWGMLIAGVFAVLLGVAFVILAIAHPGRS